MDGGKSDASTSTADDVKDLPLCFFYFTHPFGIVSPEPPQVSAAPPGFTRAFVNMEPFLWTSSAASTASPPPPSSVRYELGPARVHAAPLSVGGRRDSSLSSALLASDLWFPSSGELPRRAPYARMLPPLRLPCPRDPADYGPVDVWPRKCLNRFSLPPIELPPPDQSPSPRRSPPGLCTGRREELSGVESVARCRRQIGVKKVGRGRGRGRGGGRGRGAADVRRMVTGLMQRAIRVRGVLPPTPTGEPRFHALQPPALHHVLTTIREAWAEPASLRDRCRVMSRMFALSGALERASDSESASALAAPERGNALPPPPCRARADLALQPRPDASPGLFRRRYSVPETIMRKYRLAQQNSDSEECGTTCGGWDTSCGACASLSLSPSPSPAARSAGESPRHLRRDRELMRKSALLRRMWARPAPSTLPAPTCDCETRSLDGSQDELRAAEGGRARWPDPKRQCFGRFPSAQVSEEGDPSDATVSPPPATPLRAVSTTDDESFSTSVATAKETPAPLSSSAGLASSELQRKGLTRPHELSVDSEERTAHTSGISLTRPYGVLEIAVSESSSGSPPMRTRPCPRPALYPPRGGINIDEYVSRVLVESLHSLSDRLECVSTDSMSVVEKEIKVRLQNAAVNTIVHLSPTSNNQIIFGNAELCDERRRSTAACDVAGAQRDACNNPCTPAECPSMEDNNNAPSVSPSPTLTPTPLEGFDIRHDTVNRAVLQQIQKLFRDELHREEQSSSRDDVVGAISHIEISNVGVFLSPGDAPSSLTSCRGDAGTPITGVGAGNYYPDNAHFALVPRCSALPHSVSMEVNTSSEEEVEGEAFASDATSLVDSLDDPASPRLPSRPRPALARSALDVLDLLPDGAPNASAAQERDGPGGEAFFVRIRDDAPVEDAARVAECMPERIRQRLHRRHRKRELRVECARRSRVRQLRDELERRRRDELAQDCSALLDDLLSDVIAGAVHDEYRGLRVRRRDRDGARREAEPRARESYRSSKRDARHEEERGRRADKQQVRGKLLARPSIATTAAERGSRRIYQKSEIHEGDKCIEILEILEFSHASRSSPESTPTDEGRTARTRRSRIPVPCSAGRGEHMRLTGGGVADLLMRALATPTSTSISSSPASRVAVSEPRSRSNSLRFKRVFDMIPEERTSLSVDSSDDTAAGGLAPHGPAAATTTRSAGTSPLAEARRRTQTTMTSPCVRSAATSPPPPPPPPRPPPLARAGSRERSEPVRPERRSAATQNDRTRRMTRAAADAAHLYPAASKDESNRMSAAPPAGACSPAGVERGGGESGGADSGASSSSGDSGGSLLCSLAPRWLSGHARHHRRPRRVPPPPAAPPPLPQSGTAGGWSVTVAGSCRAALPADVEMRLRFPHEHRGPHAPRDCTTRVSSALQECACAMCVDSGAPPAAPALPPARPPSWLHRDRDREHLTLTMKKEAEDSSLVATKSTRKSSELPDLETYRANRSKVKVKSSVKTRRGYSLHCWLPDDEPAPLRANNGLSVLGCAIIPELKPRVPTMSERDLTRVYTPRHYLRS